MRLKFICFLLFVGLAVACNQQSAVPTAVAETGPTYTAEPIAPTSEPTATQEPATPTAVGPAATATPVPSPTPIPTATATPTPAAVSLLSLADFNDHINWLTGEYFADNAVLQRRPIAVKVSNSPAEWVRPQSGLSQADLVFEHATEGPITRFTAIFYSQAPEKIGPIRSARLIDAEIPAMYDAALAYSGSSIGVSKKLGGSDFRPRLIRSFEEGYYRTGEDKPFEHTLYGDPQGFWRALAAKEENHAPLFQNFVPFTTETPTGGEAAGKIQIRYKDFTTIDWEYDPGNGRYWRWVDGEPFTDANNGEQISARNIVAVVALHQLDQSICESQQADSCGAFSTEIQIWGSAPAIVFRDGQRYDGTWQRTHRGDMFTFYDEAGNPIPLQIGNTWIQVIPWHYSDPITSTP